VSSQHRFGLARVLSKLGYCSRSQAALLIRSRKVSLNGRIVADPEAPARMDRDRVAVDGIVIAERPKIYLAMNKPRGVVTTASDEQGRRTVYSFLSQDHAWVGPVGRLDKASEGLLLLTNDSEWAARITDPGTHLDKTYHVQIDRVADPQLLDALRRGVTDAGDLLQVRSVRVLRAGHKNSWLEISLDEGKNRHIRRLLDALDVGVLRLLRVSIGPLQLGDLKKGSARPLGRSEKQSLDDALSTSRPKKTAGACR